MALAATPLAYALGTVAASGTSVAVSVQPPDNCHTVQVTNRSAAVTGLVGQGTAPAPLTVGVDAFSVPPGTTRTLGIGMVGGDRAAVSNLIADSIGGAVTLEFTYVNALGSSQ